MVNLRILSTATSAQDRCVLASYLLSSSTVTSPDLQNEKKVTNAAAHSITELKEGTPLIQIGLIFLRIAGVIGSWERGAFPSFPRSTLTPLRICRNLGI